MTTTYEWHLEPVARSVPEARRHIRAALDAWHLDHLVEAAMLLTSEVVTNAVLHARTRVTLRVTREGDTAIRVDVTDGSPVIPAMRHRSDTATTGRGIRMLEQLADEWQTDATDSGKTVAFRLSTARDPWASARGGVAEAEA